MLDCLSDCLLLTIARKLHFYLLACLLACLYIWLQTRLFAFTLFDSSFLFFAIPLLLYFYRNRHYLFCVRAFAGPLTISILLSHLIHSYLDINFCLASTSRLTSHPYQILPMSVCLCLSYLPSLPSFLFHFSFLLSYPTIPLPLSLSAHFVPRSLSLISPHLLSPHALAYSPRVSICFTASCYTLSTPLPFHHYPAPRPSENHTADSYLPTTPQSYSNQAESFNPPPHTHTKSMTMIRISPTVNCVARTTGPRQCLGATWG